MVGLGEVSDLSLNVLIFSMDFSHISRENCFFFFLLEVMAGNASVSWKTVTVARSKVSEGYS